MKKGNLYIVKPISGSGGIGVKVFNNSDKLKKYIADFKIMNMEKRKLLKTKLIKEWIIEDYIQKPLLVNEEISYKSFMSYIY